MLQQTTTVEAVKTYFAKFTARWPSNRGAGGEADNEDVMKAWAGARLLFSSAQPEGCADLVRRRAKGFPTEDGLRALPGIGAYGGDHHDALAKRPRSWTYVRARRPQGCFPCTPLQNKGRKYVPAWKGWCRRTGNFDFAQAMMDLGATISAAGRAACCARCGRITAPSCPAIGILPGEASQGREKPLRRGRPSSPSAATVRSCCASGEKGLLGGMTRSADDRLDGTGRRRDRRCARFPADWRHAGRIGHVFAHFALRLEIYMADVGGTARPAISGRILPRSPGRGPADRHEGGQARLFGATKRVPLPESATREKHDEIRHIVFDIGRVLIHYDPGHSISRLIPD